MPNTYSASFDTIEKKRLALEVANRNRIHEVLVYRIQNLLYIIIMISLFVGHFYLMNKSIGTCPLSDEQSGYLFFDLLFVSLGCVFSLGWYFANRGSRYWIRNYEEHIKALEDDVTGPFFKTLLDPEVCYERNASDSFPYSLTKLNLVMSLIVFITWVILFLYFVLVHYSKCYDCYPISKKWHFFAVIVVLPIVLIYMGNGTRYSFGKYKKLSNGFVQQEENKES